jgi:hypothetical protein
MHRITALNQLIAEYPENFKGNFFYWFLDFKIAVNVYRKFERSEEIAIAASNNIYFIILIFLLIL